MLSGKPFDRVTVILQIAMAFIYAVLHGIILHGMVKYDEIRVGILQQANSKEYN